MLLKRDRQLRQKILGVVLIYYANFLHLIFFWQEPGSENDIPNNRAATKIT